MGEVSRVSQEPRKRDEGQFTGVIVRIAISLFIASVIGLLGWMMTEAGRTAALEKANEGFSAQLEQIRADQHEIKQDVRDIHQFLFGQKH